MSKESVHDFFENTLKFSLMKIEKKRQRILKKYGILLIIIIIIGVVMGLTLLKTPLNTLSSETILGGLAFLFLVVFGGFYLFIKPHLTLFQKEFKHKIIKEMVTYLNPNLKYSPTKVMNLKIVEQSKLFDQRIDRYQGDDYVEGYLGKTYVSFSEIKAENKEIYVDSKGRESHRWKPIFKGLFFCVDFNKHFKSEVFIVKRSLLSFLSKRNKVVLENPEFEKAFDVYAIDPIEARYIITPTFMERLMRFKNNLNKEIQLSFVKGVCCIAIPYKADLFEPSLMRNLVDITIIQSYFEDLHIVKDIVDSLQLNTRIWSKQ